MYLKFMKEIIIAQVYLREKLKKKTKKKNTKPGKKMRIRWCMLIKRMSNTVVKLFNYLRVKSVDTTLENISLSLVSSHYSPICFVFHPRELPLS